MLASLRASTAPSSSRAALRLFQSERISTLQHIWVREDNTLDSTEEGHQKRISAYRDFVLFGKLGPFQNAGATAGMPSGCLATWQIIVVQLLFGVTYSATMSIPCTCIAQQAALRVCSCSQTKVCSQCSMSFALNCVKSISSALQVNAGLCEHLL